MYSVYVNSINPRAGGGYLVTASNGGNDGPPLITVGVDANKVKNITIGMRLSVTIDEL